MCCAWEWSRNLNDEEDKTHWGCPAKRIVLINKFLVTLLNFVLYLFTYVWCTVIHEDSEGFERLCPMMQKYLTRYIKQDRKCRYNVTLRRVHATIVAVEKQWVLHNLSVCICNLKHPANNAHAPYSQLWSAPLYSIFPHFLINGTIFGKSHWSRNKCFDILYNVCLKHFSF